MNALQIAYFLVSTLVLRKTCFVRVMMFSCSTMQKWWLTSVEFHFYRAALNAEPSSREKGVCLSVRPSVCQTHELWQHGRKIFPDFYTTRNIIWPSFPRKRMAGGGDPFYLKFWVKATALEQNRRFSVDIRS